MKIYLTIPRDEFGNLAQPDIRPVKESGQLYRAYAPFTITVNGVRITVPEGFTTDGASSPRLAWTLTGFAKDGMHRAAAHIHDYIYECKGSLPCAPGFYFTRETADAIFYEMLKAYGIKNWHAWMAFQAVRAAGGSYWEE